MGWDLIDSVLYLLVVIHRIMINLTPKSIQGSLREHEKTEIPIQLPSREH